jgi:SAM-dependent methyltransferase
MDSTALLNGSPSAWRTIARRLITAPGVRLLAPGWPDSGRRIVQLPAIEPLIAAATRGRSIARTLNAGAGEGLHAPLIRKYAPHALMVEFDYGRPQKSTDRQLQRFCASLDAIALASESVDVAVCTEVLEHVLDDESAVAELARVLTRDGHLVLSVPTPPAVPDPAHVREGYSLEQLRALFGRHGLEILEANYCMHRCFQAVLHYWRPRRVPLGAILILAWLDRMLKPGAPMDLAVLARRRPRA